MEVHAVMIKVLGFKKIEGILVPKLPHHVVVTWITFGHRSKSALSNEADRESSYSGVIFGIFSAIICSVILTATGVSGPTLGV